MLIEIKAALRYSRKGQCKDSKVNGQSYSSTNVAECGSHKQYTIAMANPKERETEEVVVVVRVQRGKSVGGTSRRWIYSTVHIYSFMSDISASRSVYDSEVAESSEASVS